MSAALAVAISLSAMGCPANDPGTVVVVGGSLQPLPFTLPSGIAYRVNYNTSRLSLWFDAGQTMPVALNTTYTAPVAFAHGDMNVNGKIDGADIQRFIAVFIGANTNLDQIMRADFDQNSVVNSSDTNLFVTALVSGATVPPSMVTFYGHGLSASTALCDTPVDVSTDPQGTGMFAVFQTQEVTVASLSVNPLMGPLGTPLTLTVSPAITPLVFDASTTATWAGVYDPDSGPPSTQFTISYNASQVREQTNATAIIVLGDGSASGLPGPSGLTQPGTFIGSFTVNFQGVLATKGVSLAVTEPPFLAHIDYQDTSTTSGPAVRGGEITETPVLYANPDTLAAPSLAAVQTCGWAHLVPVLYLQENSITIANGPATVNVKVATFNAAEALVAETGTLVLTKVPDPDGDSSHLIYSGDLNQPLVLLDVSVNPVDYPGFTVLYMPTSAVSVRVVPAN